MSDQPTYEQLVYNSAVQNIKNCSDGHYKTVHDAIKAAADFAGKIQDDPDTIQKIIILAMKATKSATVDVLADRLGKIGDPTAGTGGASSPSPRVAPTKPVDAVNAWIAKHNNGKAPPSNG